MNIKSISIEAFPQQTRYDRSFVTAFVFRGADRGKQYHHITPSSLRRLMRWQAATFLAERKSEAQPERQPQSGARVRGVSNWSRDGFTR